MTKEDKDEVLQLIKYNDEQNLKLFAEQIADRKEEVWKDILSLGKSIGILEEYPEDYPQYYFRDVFYDIENYFSCIKSSKLIKQSNTVKAIRLLEFIGFYWSLHWLSISLHDIQVDKFL